MEAGALFPSQRKKRRNGPACNFHQGNRVRRVILGFLHVVRVCMKVFDCLSSAKWSPFSPTPLCNNVHKSGFFPPGENFIQNLNFYIVSRNFEAEIHVPKRSREPRKPHSTGLLAIRVLPKIRYWTPFTATTCMNPIVYIARAWYCFWTSHNSPSRLRRFATCLQTLRGRLAGSHES